MNGSTEREYIPSPDEIERLKGFAQIFLQFVSCALIVCHKTNSPEEDVIGNGTLSYIDTGETKLLVTCDHVYAEYESLRSENDAVEFCVAPSPGQKLSETPTLDVLDRNRNVDICTLGFTVSKAYESLHKCFLKPKAWPPQRVVTGDLVIGIGFPGRHRQTEYANGIASLALNAMIVSGVVTSVSDRHFTIADEERSRFMYSPDSEDLVPAWGGMSGGIFLRKLNTSEGEAETYELAGFMKEGGSIMVLDTSGPVSPSSDTEEDIHATLFVSHADLIGEDGMLDYTLIPY